MIDHVSVAVAKLAESTQFYENVLAPLGYQKMVERPASVGFGKTYPEFWINLRPDLAPGAPDTGAHVCLRAPDEESVRAFHHAALMQGGRSDGEPGPRQGAITTYYGAFIRDLDGNKIEAVTFPASK
jgi:catechol 2,3-dioxygenase-like lactoylglutathione lyase family enzyme